MTLCVVAAAAAFLALPWAWLRQLEAETRDFRLRLRGSATAPSPVVLVTIEDSSFTILERAPRDAAQEPVLRAMGQPWPWDRRVFAAVVEKLSRAGARAVVCDIVFAAETPGDGEFASALAASPVPVVLARHYVVSDSLEGERSVSLLEPRRELTLSPRVRTGYGNIWPDDDGVVRRARLTLDAGEWLGDSPGDGREESLAWAALRAAYPGRAAPREGLIDFRGPAGAVPRVPIENLFLPDRWQGAVIRGGELFRDRIVVVGPWSELRFKDYHATPFGRMAGVELQGNIIAALGERGLLWEWPAWGELLTVLGAALLGGAISVRGATARGQAAGLLVALAAWLGGAQLALAWRGGMLPVAAPAGALMVAGLGGIVVRYAGEQRERRRLRALLASYVSEQVAEVIVRQPESLAAALRGERRPVTVLFADLRGFTALSEQRAPELLVAQLNEYLHAMVDCVLAEGGTLQKFIGDAVLAVWGDTHSEGEAADAARAVKAALAMEAACARLNAAWSGRADRVPLRMGIGLQHGVVTVGNLGHPRRMEFAVLGDAVNTASRLEGATKHLGVPLLVGGGAARQAGARFRFAPVCRLGVAGRAEPLETFTPVNGIDEPEPAWLAEYQTALAELQAGEAAAAHVRLSALAPAEPRLRALIEFQTRRVAGCMQRRGEPWSDIIRLEEK